MGWVAVLDTNKAIGGIWPAKATEGWILVLNIAWHGRHSWSVFWFGLGQRRQSFFCVQRYPGMGAARLALGWAGCIEAISTWTLT